MILLTLQDMCGCVGCMTDSVWARDYQNVHLALAPFVIDTPDGQFVDTREAPPELVRLHSDLASIGYAHGWL